MKHIARMTSVGVAVWVGACAAGQVVINEVFENPPNGGDQTWEYIELYGPPGYDLTGYAVALIKGGQDDDPSDDVPDAAFNQKSPEIDEAFTLDGWTIGANGLFTIYDSDDFGFTGLAGYLTANPGWQFFLPETPANKRFLDGASFKALHVPNVDVVGRLENDGSSTYLLVRKRPGHSLDAGGKSVYAPNYAWKKDVTPDVDFNSRLDFGDEDTLGVPVWYGDGLDGAQSTALQLEPVQIVDEIAWSNAGGKEYNLPGRGDRSGKLSETPGFNPDCLSRVRYLVDPLLIGSTINGNTGELGSANVADDSWIYGETLNVPPGSVDYGVYKGLIEAGADTVVGTSDDELNLLAPTNPGGATYSYDGPGDDDPLTAPFFADSGALDPGGSLLFEPYDTDGFRNTPGAFNDAPSGSALAATEIAQQFRFVVGDLNFDGTVDGTDLAWAQAHLGASLDDTADLVRDFNTPDTSDDVVYTGWKYQAQDFNGLLALVRMDLTDGTTGEWDSGVFVMQADVDAVAALVPCPADIDHNGVLNLDDVSLFASAFIAGSAVADVTGDGVLNLDDISVFAQAFIAGCP